MGQGLLVSMQATVDEFGAGSPEAEGVAGAIRGALAAVSEARGGVVVLSAVDAVDGVRGAGALAQWRAAVGRVEGGLRRLADHADGGDGSGETAKTHSEEWTAVIVAVLVWVVVAATAFGAVSAMVNMPFVRDSLLYSKAKTA